MTRVPCSTLACAAILAAATFAPAGAASANTTVQIGASGKTFASTAPACAMNPATGLAAPQVQAGLFNPGPRAKGTVSLNGLPTAALTAAEPVADVWLANGVNQVSVVLNKRAPDLYSFTVSAGQCNLPDTSGNFLSADGSLEYAASGKSYATVVPGCARNPATGQAQPFVNLFDNGTFLLNVSVNGVPLTQLSARRPRTPVFLKAGLNVISAANGSLSTDHFIRDGGPGSCALP